MAKKKVAAVVKIQIPAGQATPAPPVGTALGPHGVAIMDFCKMYNAQTENQRGTIVPVEITVFEDRSFTFILKTPPTPVLLRQAAGVDKGAVAPGRDGVGTVTDAQVAEIAKTKMPDLNANDLDAAKKQVAGTARSMGIRSSDGTVTESAIVDATRGRSTPRRLMSPPEAIDVCKRTSKAKFDETIELAVRLGVDPRKADQIVRGTVALPSGTGKDVRVAVFAAGDAAAEARAAGADIVGADDLAAQIEGGHARLRRRHRHARPHAARRPARPHARPPGSDAEPEDRHRHRRGRQGRRRVQGRQGRVPHRSVRQHPRADRQGELPDAKRSTTNFRAVLDELQRAKPASAKGRYIKSITLAPTMGPGVNVDPNRLREELAAS